MSLKVRLSFNAVFMILFVVLLAIQTCKDMNKVTKTVNRLKKILAMAMIIYNIVHILYRLSNKMNTTNSIIKGTMPMLDYSVWGICIYLVILYLF